MGKKLIKASVWTWRSMWSLYGKVITMVFALFCVSNGLFARTTSDAKDVKSIRGKAFNNDSSVLGNIKIYMGAMVCPLYGVDLSCILSTSDSVVTDSMGNFQINKENFSLNSLKHMNFFKLDSSNNERHFKHDLSIDSILNDTSIVLYLMPLTKISAAAAKTSKPVNFTKMISGNIVNVKIANWFSDEKYSAKITDVAGRLIASPEISRNGLLHWNTENCASGVYFLNVISGKNILNAQILVR